MKDAEDLSPSPWAVTVSAGAALAVGMGIGRFVYTPILPLMVAQAGLTAHASALLATANYIGYLAGAIIGIVAPKLIRSSLMLRVSLVAVVITVALMPATTDVASWFALRLLTGVASALIFVIAVSAMLSHLKHHPGLTGWGFGGVGAGIALAGVLVAIVRSISTWSAAWWASAILAAVLSSFAWKLKTAPAPPLEAKSAGTAPPKSLGRFCALLVSYSLEGMGYIIAGTFLVAAIEERSPGWIGGGAWILVGLAALPSCALWAWLAHRRSRPTLLLAALLVQAVGIALPALFAGVAPALLSAVLFGATFLGVTTIALGIGSLFPFPRAVAILTAGYSVGQILGPLIVAPVLAQGYQPALLISAGVVIIAAVAAAVLRIGFPRRLESVQVRDESVR